MPKKSRELGKVGERAAAIFFRVVYPLAKRSRDQYTAQGQRPDVEGTPFWLEVKYWETYPDLYAALQQGRDEAKENDDSRKVVAVTKRKNKKRNLSKPWIATMYLEDFVLLCEELEHYRRLADEQ